MQFFIVSGLKFLFSNKLLDDVDSAGQWIMLGVAEFYTLTHLNPHTLNILKQTSNIMSFHP